MLVVDKIRAAGATPCSLIVGTGSLERIGRAPGSLGTEVGLISSSTACAPSLGLPDDGGDMGNLNSGIAAEPVRGGSREPPMLGVFGTVDAADGRPFEELPIRRI